MQGKSLKPTLFVVTLLTLTVSANAQWDAAIKGGISIPNLSAAGSQQNPLNTGYSSRLGPDFAIDHEYHFSNLFSLVSTVEFSSQGGKKNGYQAFATPPQIAGYFEEQNMTPPPYLYADYNSEAKFSYLLLPILAKVGWDFGHLSPWRFYVAAGPFLGILLSAKQVTSGNSMVYADAGKTEPLPIGSQSFDQKTDLMDQLHHVNFGIDGYIGFSYALNAARNQHLFVEAGGNYGFINIQKGTANGKNNTGAGVVTLGYSREMHAMWKCMHKKKAS